MSKTSLVPSWQLPTSIRMVSRRAAWDWGDLLKDMTFGLSRSLPGRGGEREERWSRQKKPWVLMPTGRRKKNL